MSVETGRYYTLSHVSARIWGLVERHARVSDVCDRLAREYDVELALCQTEVLEFVRGLYEEGLVVAPLGEVPG